MKTAHTLLLLLPLVACSGRGPEPREGSPTGAQAAAMLGGCILAEPLGDAPPDPYLTGQIQRSDAYPPFTRRLMAHGLLLVAGDDASAEFLETVAATIGEIFPRDPGLDLERQAAILEAHYLYRAVVPVPVGEAFGFMETEAFERTAGRNSICDVIMQDVPGQVMEVVEHILHYVSDIGLATAYPDDWGITETSTIARGMREAIDAGLYDITQYAEIGEGSEEHLRVLIQEYAYWVISTYWDLQAAYGPVGEAEWSLVTPDQLRQHQPVVWDLLERTVGRTMRPPSAATLRSIGPTRVEERAATTG